MSPVFCLSALQHVGSGLFQLEKTTSLMLGELLMEHPYSRLVKHQKDEDILEAYHM